MLKSYDLRVNATYALMQSFIEYVAINSEQIKNIRLQSKQKIKSATEFPVRWELNKSKYKQVLYKGFESGYKPSEVSGCQDYSMTEANLLKR